MCGCPLRVICCVYLFFSDNPVVKSAEESGHAFYIGPEVPRGAEGSKLTSELVTTPVC